MNDSNDEPQILRESGERLSVIADKFNARKATPDEFMTAVAEHCGELASAGLVDQAFATSVIALVNMFRRGASPEDAPDAFVSSLFNLILYCAEMQQQSTLSGDQFALDHFTEMGKNLIPVLLDLKHSLERELHTPAHISEMIESLEQVDHNCSFQGSHIDRFLAFDILCDCASRLASMELL